MDSIKRCRNHSCLQRGTSRSGQLLRPRAKCKDGNAQAGPCLAGQFAQNSGKQAQDQREQNGQPAQQRPMRILRNETGTFRGTSHTEDEGCRKREGIMATNDGSKTQKNTGPLSKLPPAATCWNSPRKRGFQACVDGEPDACKRASPVLRGGAG